MSRPAPLSLLEQYDAAIFDLDGTLMHGPAPIPHAADGVAAARDAGVRVVFATNNASRTPDEVIAHLETVGVTGRPDEVITSPQVAMGLLDDAVPSGSPVLVVGGDALASQVRASGFEPRTSDADDVRAVIQGWAPTVDWSLLAEGAYAIRRGAAWIATNTDATLPTERGMAPGNGSLVACLRHATGAVPAVAGKPEPAMFQQASRMAEASRPLAVGDRLDTDIACARAAGIDSLLVLTGVSTLAEAVRAVPQQRPTWVLPDLGSLGSPCPDAVVDGERARCASSAAELVDGDLEITGPLDAPATWRAVLALVDAARPDFAFDGAVRTADGAELPDDEIARALTARA